MNKLPSKEIQADLSRQYRNGEITITQYRIALGCRTIRNEQGKLVYVKDGTPVKRDKRYSNGRCPLCHK